MVMVVMMMMVIVMRIDAVMNFFRQGLGNQRLLDTLQRGCGLCHAGKRSCVGQARAT